MIIDSFVGFGKCVDDTSALACLIVWLGKSTGYSVS